MFVTYPSQELEAFSHALQASLDCYAWIFSENFISPEVFTLGVSTSRLFPALQAYVSNFALLGRDAVLTARSIT
jgi:hypothetical protein